MSTMQVSIEQYLHSSEYEPDADYVDGEIDPETGVFSRFKDGQLVRRSEFLLPERRMTFAMAEIAALVR